MAASRFLLAPTNSSFGSGLVCLDPERENMGYNVYSNQGQLMKPVFVTNNGVPDPDSSIRVRKNY